MKYYAVIDTNVILSALLAKRIDSPTVVIIKQIFNGIVVPVFNNEILEEYSEVLKRRKFNFNAQVVDNFLYEIQQHGLLFELEHTEVVLPDMKDVPFYAVTLTHGVEDTYLVTGNLKHFPTKTFVVRPAQFLEILQS